VERAAGAARRPRAGTVRRLTSLTRVRTRARRVLAPAALAGAGLLGCASQGVPPGGPPDALPPQVLRVVPDTGAVNARPARVVFRFDEVVSERPQGAATLDALFLISPRDGEPRVDWDREQINIRPRRSWRRNTVYTVTMLPGLTDLRGNTRRDGAVAVFSTGPEIPNTRLTGTVYDWAAGRPVPRAFAEAVAAGDTTLVYVSSADSTGRFVFSHLPPGSYRVRGYADANNNRALDPRELWDSVRVALRDSASTELLAFVHDTIGPRVSTVAAADSVTLRLELDRPVDPAQQITAAMFSVTASDSTRLRIVRASPATAFDERKRAADSVARARADTAPRPPAPPPAADTARRPAPLTGALARPRPVSAVVLELGSALRPATTYRVESRGLRGLLGATATASRSFTTERAVADSARAPADTTRRPGADTTRRARPAPRPAAPPRPPR